jgi:hypothetical protein
VTDVQDVAIVPAVADDAAPIANLLGLYQHDLGEIFPVELGTTGRFGYERLPLYCSEPTYRPLMPPVCRSRPVEEPHA